MAIQRALKRKEAALTPDEAKMVEERLTEHDRDPASAIPLAEVMKRLRAEVPDYRP